MKKEDKPRGALITIIVIGLILCFGPMVFNIIKDINHKEYIKTDAFFIQAYQDSTSDDGTKMYRLVYKYNVNNNEYYYTTEHTTSIIPKNNSKIAIKYNPVNPNMRYSNSDNIVFELLGIMFIFIPMMMLCEKAWSRDILLFIFTLLMINGFFSANLNNGVGIIVIIVLGILGFASIMDFISYLKENQNFSIRKEIEEARLKRKELKIIKKEHKNNISIEEKNIKKKKIKRICKGILLMLIVPLNIFIEIQGWFPNETIYIIASIISSICTMVGFVMAGMALTGFIDSDNTTVIIGGKVIDNEDLKNINKMTLKEKLIKFNILRTIIQIFFAILFLVVICCIMEDPLNFFENFENVGRAQIFSIFGLVIIYASLWIFIGKIKLTRIQLMRYVITCIILFSIGYYMTIPKAENKEIITSDVFEQIMTYNGFKLTYNNNPSNINSNVIINAINNNMEITYYEFDDIKTTKKSYEELKEYYLSICKYDQAATKGQYFEVDCNGRKKTWIISRVKNTIIYGKVDYENKDNLIEFINDLGYGYK